MKVLIGFEESQAVAKAFRARGHEAYSCDILPCSGGHPEWHIHDDVFKYIDDYWDIVITHPECRYLTCTRNKWYKPEYKDRFPNAENDRKNAIDTFMRVAKLLENSKKIKSGAIENPQGIMSTIYRKPDQYIQPFWFGHPYSKKTGLWLYNLPPLKKTNEVKAIMERMPNGKMQSVWHTKTGYIKDPAERRRVRSTTPEGIADAMADQWGNLYTSISR